MNSDEYINCVKECPVCSQGWVQILRKKDSEELLLCCSECEVSWNDPNEVDWGNGKLMFGEDLVFATSEEIIKKGWDKFLLS